MSHFKTSKLISRVIDPKKYLNSFPIMPKTKIDPPDNVRGMKILDKTLFDKVISVPWIEIEDHMIKWHNIMKHIKKYFFKVPNFIPVINTSKQNLWNEESIISSNKEEIVGNDLKRFLFNPCVITSLDDFDEISRNILTENGVKNLNFIKLLMTYDNWRIDELIKAILPQDQEIVSSYSKIGHIIHLNLKEHLLEFKFIIGTILLDKIKNAKTIVNKTNEINSKYRNFQMEILAGVEDYNVQVKENHCTFKFDFSKVYWNPRLSTEHERIVGLLKSSDVLYDVFTGNFIAFIRKNLDKFCCIYG